jgi:alanine transaminase
VPDAAANASATLVLPADAPAPADFPACLPPRDALPPLPPLDDDYERRVSFSPFANWLIPGALALGRYPFVEPSRCGARAQGEAQLAALMAPPLRRGAAAAGGAEGGGGSVVVPVVVVGGGGGGGSGTNGGGESFIPAASAVNNGNPGLGVRTFFSLQAELPPQWLMPVGGAAGGFLPYKAAAELIRAGMAGPPPQEALDGLRNPQLDRFLPPRRRALSPQYAAFARRESALAFVHCPIADLGTPEGGQLKAAVADLAGRLAAAEAARRKQQQQQQQETSGGAGGSSTTDDANEDDAAGAVLLHCWGGRGRAGLVGACLLVAAYGLGADEALQRVQRAFDTRRDNERRSPETDAQHAWARAFAAELGRVI